MLAPWLRARPPSFEEGEPRNSNSFNVSLGAEQWSKTTMYQENRMHAEQVRCDADRSRDQDSCSHSLQHIQRPVLQPSGSVAWTQIWVISHKIGDIQALHYFFRTCNIPARHHSGVHPAIANSLMHMSEILWCHRSFSNFAKLCLGTGTSLMALVNDKMAFAETIKIPRTSAVLLRCHWALSVYQWGKLLWYIVKGWTKMCAVKAVFGTRIQNHQLVIDLFAMERSTIL